MNFHYLYSIVIAVFAVLRFVMQCWLIYTKCLIKAEYHIKLDLVKLIESRLVVPCRSRRCVWK